jgi:hypothetical protein
MYSVSFAPRGAGAGAGAAGFLQSVLVLKSVWADGKGSGQGKSKARRVLLPNGCLCLCLGGAARGVIPAKLTSGLMTSETDLLSAESAPTMTASMASRMCCMLGRTFESAWRHVDSVAHSRGGHCVDAMCAWLVHGWLLSN